MSLKTRLIAVHSELINLTLRGLAPMPTDRVPQDQMVAYEARAFDRKSFSMLAQSIRAGVFGRRSPRLFFLEVSSVLDEDSSKRMVIYSPIFLERVRQGVKTYVPNRFLARDLGEFEKLFDVTVQ